MEITTPNCSVLNRGGKLDNASRAQDCDDWGWSASPSRRLRREGRAAAAAKQSIQSTTETKLG
jgi:hypothetical protein